MEIVVGKGLQEWVEQAHEWCQRIFIEEQCRSFYLPAGNTPIPLYQFWEKERPRFLSESQLVQVDDVLTGEKTNLFFQFFQRELPTWVKHIQKPNQEYYQAEAAILGLGKNGHLGFHEPSLSEWTYFACVPLEEITCRSLQLEAGTWGVTYGLQAFLRCRSVLLLVRGEEKGEILRKIIGAQRKQGDLISLKTKGEEANQSLPPAAQLLLKHPRVTVLCDEEVYGTLR